MRQIISPFLVRFFATARISVVIFVLLLVAVKKDPSFLTSLTISNLQIMGMIIKNSLMTGMIVCLLGACKKSDQFINTSLPTGSYYYPIILNTLIDSGDKTVLNDHYYNAGDTVSFEVDFFSQDSVSNILLTATIAGKTDTVSNIPYSNNLYSSLKNADTVLFQYFIPATSPQKTVILQSTVYTIYNIYTSEKATIYIR